MIEMQKRKRRWAPNKSEALQGFMRLNLLPRSVRPWAPSLFPRKRMLGALLRRPLPYRRSRNEPESPSSAGMYGLSVK